MTGEQLKEVLKNRGVVYGTMLSLCRNPRWARVLGGLKFDYIIVDTEHSPFSRGEVADFVAMLQRVDTVPIVRVPTPDPHYVSMAIDAGAHGVLAPYCETVEQVKGVVGAAKLRPMKGGLLKKAIDTDEYPSDELKAYLKNFNKNSLVMIGIESVPAVDNLKAILQVDGIDVIFVGPHDLSVSLGIPEKYSHPSFEKSVRHIIKVCDSKNIPVAIHLHNVESSSKWIKEGMRFVLFGSDSRAMFEGFRGDFDALRAFAQELKEVKGKGKKVKATKEHKEVI